MGGRGVPIGTQFKTDAECRGRYRKIGGVPAHRIIVEERTGIKLPETAVVHHCDPSDRLSNKGPFIVCQDQAYHTLLEMRTRALDECGNANWRKCDRCGKWDAPENLRITERNWKPGWFTTFHRRVRGACVSGEPYAKPSRQHGVGRTEGIWEAVSATHVRCILCGLETKGATLPCATHAKIHVREGTAIARKEPSRRHGTRTVYEPAPEALRRRGAASEGK